MFKKAHDNQLRLAIDAIGDRANTIVLDTLESLQDTHRHLSGSSVEHAQLLLAEDLSKFASLGLIASVQPQHAVDDKDLAGRFWSSRAHRAFPNRWLLDAGVTLKLGSDAPVAPLDPWIAMAAAVSRKETGTDGAQWHPEQQIPAQVAYEASRCTGKTRPSVGGVADLCILPYDPVLCSPDELRAMKPLGTLVAGRVISYSMT